MKTLLQKVNDAEPHSTIYCTPEEYNLLMRVGWAPMNEEERIIGKLLNGKEILVGLASSPPPEDKRFRDGVRFLIMLLVFAGCLIWAAVDQAGHDAPILIKHIEEKIHETSI